MPPPSKRRKLPSDVATLDFREAEGPGAPTIERLVESFYPCMDTLPEAREEIYGLLAWLADWMRNQEGNPQRCGNAASLNGRRRNAGSTIPAIRLWLRRGVTAPCSWRNR